MLSYNYFEERLRNERTGKQESWIVRFSDDCWARAGRASSFEHEQWVMHVEHIECGHIALCRGACGDVGVCTQTKTRWKHDESRKRRLARVLRDMMEAGKAGGARTACTR